MPRARIGIAGMDHWYAGIGAATQAQEEERAELVVVAHRDGVRAAEVAGKYGAEESTDDLMSVVTRDDIDLVITACTTAENPALATEAVRSGKHVIGVKPMAMTVQDAQALAAEVKKANRRYFSLESQQRLAPRWQRVKNWVDEGKMGSLVSMLEIFRGTLPTQDWPGHHVERTWWLDPTKVPGGGWIDHAIYYIDVFRWLLEDEVVQVSGEVSNLRHPDLEVEDFGVATLRFAGDATATVEVTWAGTPDAPYTSTHIVGTKGQVIANDPFTGKVATAGNLLPAHGWVLSSEPQAGRRRALSHVLDAIFDDNPLIANEDDAVENIRVCLAFYEAAREGKVVRLR